MTARAVALVKSLFMLSITSNPLPSRLHLLIVPLAELIQYIFPAGKSIESPEGKRESVRNCYLECWYGVIYLTYPITTYVSEHECKIVSLKYSCNLLETP